MAKVCHPAEVWYLTAQLTTLSHGITSISTMATQIMNLSVMLSRLITYLA